jgi:hypothetical protein
MFDLRADRRKQMSKARAHAATDADVARAINRVSDADSSHEREHGGLVAC